MAEITVPDLKQMFEGCLVIHKNKPVYINRVLSTKSYHVFDLSTQRNVTLEDVKYTDLKAPGRCLGFINVADHVVYLERKPVRRYKVGIYDESAVWNTPDDYNGVLHAAGMHNTYRFTSPELCDTIFNRYPSIPEAQVLLEAGARIVAFDRQFAIDRRGIVYYKTKRVGKVKEWGSVYDLVFDANFKHLITLLDNNHEKSIPTA